MSSVPPSLPTDRVSVAELLLRRTFARPPQPFVGADVILALTEAAHEEAVVAESAAPGDGPQVDLRA